MDERDFKEAGACFYTLPAELRPEQVDELLRETVFAINGSGWVWTGESCQGHPDATTPTGWEHNVKPMLRLICRAEDYALMLQLLSEACYRPVEEQDEYNMHYPSGLELWPQLRDGWWLKPYREILVYVPASQTISRNAGLRVFERFAEMVVEHGETRSQTSERATALATKIDTPKDQSGGGNHG